MYVAVDCEQISEANIPREQGLDRCPLSAGARDVWTCEEKEAEEYCEQYGYFVI